MEVRLIENVHPQQVLIRCIKRGFIEVIHCHVYEGCIPCWFLNKRECFSTTNNCNSGFVLMRVQA